jgi:hypothetical protein
MGGKDSKGDSGNNNGDAGGSGQELDPAPDHDGHSLPLQATAQGQHG